MEPLIVEKKKNPPILIVDKSGTLGEALGGALINDAQIVIVCENEPKEEKFVWIPFGKKPPTIPHALYSHIFMFLDMQTAELLPAVSKKAYEDKSNLILIKSLRSGENYETDYSSKTILIGDVIDKPVYKSPAFKILNKARMRGKIEIPKEGLSLLYPVFFEDAVKAILSAAFNNDKNKNFFVFQKNPISLLAFSHFLKKANPSIKMDFTYGDDLKNPKVPDMGEYVLPEPYEIETKIKKLNLEAGKIRNLEKEDFEIQKKENKFFKRVIFFLLFLFSLPISSTIVFLLLGNLFSISGKAALAFSNYQDAGRYMAASMEAFSLSSASNSIYRIYYFEKLNSQNYEIAKGYSYFFLAIDSLGKNNVSQAVVDMKNFLFFYQQQKVKGAKPDFISDKTAELLESTADYLPDILGFNGKRKYLILFANNSNLRAQGGIVQAYALVTLENGKVKDVSTGNPDDIDKEIKGEIEAPFEIQNFLKEKEWKFKDILTSLDFPTAASEASYIFSLSSKEKPDGVIVLGNAFLKKTVSLPGFLETTAGRVDDNKLAVELFSRLSAEVKKSSLNFTTLLKTLGNDIEEKNILFAFQKQEIENKLLAGGFANSLLIQENKSQSVNDFIGVYEENFGEPNASIKRSLDYRININDKNADSVLSYKIENSGGDYDLYLRFALPPVSALGEIQIDGERVDLKKEKIYSQQILGKQVYGIFVKIPALLTRTIQVSYSLSQIQTSGLSDFFYLLSLRKQAGIDYYSFNLKVAAAGFKSLTNSGLSKVETKDDKIELHFVKE